MNPYALTIDNCYIEQISLKWRHSLQMERILWKTCQMTRRKIQVKNHPLDPEAKGNEWYPLRTRYL